MSQLKLKDKVVVVTGGNSGIGLAAAKEFKAEGAKVVIAGRDETTLIQAAREIGDDTLAVRADVSKLSDLDDLFKRVKEKHGRIDVLFANAGVADFIPAHETTEEQYDKMVDINLKGTFFTLTKAFPLLGEGASVILTSSVVSEKGYPGASVYAATKAGIRSLARTLSAEWIGRGIRVNVLSPGPIKTPIFERGGANAAQLEAVTSRVVAMNPMKRFGSPEEMAKAALFLASSDSSYLTGADIKADGGSGNL